MGLVQRVIEASGIATVCLSWMPDLTRAVLRAALALLESATSPDTYVELPFEWPETRAEAMRSFRELPPPPIATLLLKKPWLLPAFYRGEIPREAAPGND